MISHTWQFWLGLGVSVLLLAVLVWQVDLTEMRESLSDANYVYLVPSIALYFMGVYFRAFRWRYLLHPLKPLAVTRLYPVVVIGYMANNLLPARLGELVRAYYLARREQLSASSALGTVAVERVYDGMTLLAWAAIAGPALWLMGEFDGAGETSKTTWIVLALVTVAAFAGALAFLTGLAASKRFRSSIYWLTGLIPERFRPKAQGLVTTFIEGTSVLNSPRKHLYLFLLSLPVWVFESSIYFLLIYSFGIDDHFGSAGVIVMVVLLLTATSNLATALPSSIGGIGPFEVVAQQTLVALGVGASVAGAYAAFLHLAALWLPVNLAGLAFIWQQNMSLKGLATALKGDGPMREALGNGLLGDTGRHAASGKEGQP